MSYMTFILAPWHIKSRWQCTSSIVHVQLINRIYFFRFPEINECIEGTQLCEHNCINTPGSYNCSCNTGYILSTNGFSCASKLMAIYFYAITSSLFYVRCWWVCTRQRHVHSELLRHAWLLRLQLWPRVLPWCWWIYLQWYHNNN